jgi:tRNA (cmo5U34)-methyltransferase
MATFFNNNVANYERLHLKYIDGGLKSKRIIADFVPEGTKQILDLGIGTGLELKYIFKKFPDVKIIGIDISKGMLTGLKKRYPNKSIKVKVANYFEFNFPKNTYPVIISSMSLHHFLFDDKVRLYKKIYNSLKNGGTFINCDFIINDSKKEKKYVKEYLKIKEKLSSEKGMIHLDIPLTLNNELKVLRKAGFKIINIPYNLPKTKLIRCVKV